MIKEKRAYPDHGEAWWLRLDNAAKIYPAIKDRELTAVFRVSAVLKERIKIKPFLGAVRFLDSRFPYYKVKLKAGFFWYYLQYHNLPIPVKADTGPPCRSFDKHGLMFRVLARKNTVSVEFSHILTDASGAFEFLKSLLAVYFMKCGLPLPPDLEYYRPEEDPCPEEYEDAYSRYFKKSPSSLIEFRRAFHLPFRLRQVPRFTVLTAVIPLNAILKKAKDYRISLTEYLISVYLFVLQDIHKRLPARSQRRSNKICRIEVPVDLRRIYPTKTMRNFSLYVLPEIDLRLGDYTFEEIAETVFHLMQLQTDKKLINKILSRNVGGEKNPFVRRIPLFIKSFIFSLFYSIGTSRYSGVITNLGKAGLAPGLNGLIDNFAFIPPPPNKTLKVNCGVIGFENRLVLCFGNITTSKELERGFLKFLSAQGLPVKIVNPDNYSGSGRSEFRPVDLYQQDKVGDKQWPENEAHDPE